MNEPNKNKKPSRWAELAEDLGLIEGSAGPAKSASPEPAAPPPPRREETLAHRPRPAPPAPEPSVVVTRVEEKVELTFEADDESIDENESIETPPALSEASPDTVLEEGEEGAGAGEGGGTSRSSSRRRRRRRSSKKKKEGSGTEGAEATEPVEGQESSGAESESESEPQPVAETEGSEKPKEEKTNERERGGRGRTRGGRRRREPEPEVVDEAAHEDDEVHESGGNVGLDEDDSDEEPVNYSNWTVPAWKDLIASLYRPDR